MKESTKLVVRRVLAKEMKCKSSQIVLLESSGSIEEGYTEEFMFCVWYSEYCKQWFRATVGRSSKFDKNHKRIISTYSLITKPERAEAYDM